MTIEEIKNLSSEEIAKMKKKEILSVLKTANKEAKRARNIAIENMKANPDKPKPQIFRDFSGRRNVQNWEEYKFVAPQKEHIATLRRRLNDVIGFLNAKTLDYSVWEKQLKEFAHKTIRGVTARDAKGRFKSQLSEKTYRNFWELYNKVLDIYNPSEFLNSTSPTFKVAGKEYSVSSYIWEQQQKHPSMSDDELAIMIADELKIHIGEKIKERNKPIREMEDSIGFGKKGL